MKNQKPLIEHLAQIACDQVRGGSGSSSGPNTGRDSGFGVQRGYYGCSTIMSLLAITCPSKWI